MPRGLPEPRSTWAVCGRTGAVTELAAGAPEGGQPRPRPRAATTCRACGGAGHNAKNKRCPARTPP